MKKQRQSKKTTTLVDKGSTETLTDKSVEQTTVRKGKKNAKITMGSKNYQLWHIRLKIISIHEHESRQLKL